jgi:hypothetical protein
MKGDSVQWTSLWSTKRSSLWISRRSERFNYEGENRIARLERVVKLMVKSGLRARRQMREQDERFERRFAALLDWQAHTDQRLDALIDIVREGRNGRS